MGDRHSKFWVAVTTFSFRGKQVSDLGELTPSTTRKVLGAPMIVVRYRTGRPSQDNVAAEEERIVSNKEQQGTTRVEHKG
jgi:hypothetical protein